jgi:integrase
MATLFTDAKLRTLKNGPRDAWHTEGGKRGEGKLVLRVSSDGTKRFYYRMPAACGNRAPVPLAMYDPTSKNGYTLARAREKVAELEALRREYGNPITYLEAEAERKVAERRKAEAEQAKQGSFGELLATYVEKLKREGKESARQVENAFRLHVHEATPALVERKAVEITPADIHRILSRIAAAGRTRQVNKMRSHLMAAFNYAATAAYDPRRVQGAVAFGLESNPAALTKRVKEFERAGERVLSANELAAYWRHLDQIANLVVRGFLRVGLLLGGQRSAQLARLKESDINLESGIIRLQDSKGRNGIPRDHLLPLTERVQEVLEAAPRIASAGGWVFTTNGRSSLRAETVSVAVAEYSAWLEKNASVMPFSARDLRRTCETRLAELGISKDIRAQLLSHGISGVQAKHYDRYSYLAEKRAALEKWESYLNGLLDPGRKVVDFATRKNRQQA